MSNDFVRWARACSISALAVFMAACAVQPPQSGNHGVIQGAANHVAVASEPSLDHCPPDSGFCERRPGAGTASTPLSGDTFGAPNAGHDSEGAAVAGHLRERYEDTQNDCRGLPAMLCSGVLLRTTERGNGYNVWNPNPNNPQPNGVSFAWLRKDNAFGRLPWNYNNGFIILPYFYADDPGDDYTQLTVLCGFPVDGGTDLRNSSARDGCGAHPSYPAVSGECQSLNVRTSSAWMAKYGGGVLYGQQCFLNVKPGTTGAAQVFAEFSKIRNSLGTRGFAIHNEVKIQAWQIGDKKIPLEAFFFQKGTTGLGEAKANQGDFYTITGRWVPVIRMTLPTVQNGAATFEYVAADQQIP